MGVEIFTFLCESKYSVSLITVPFCPVAPCPFQILAGVLDSIIPEVAISEISRLLLVSVAEQASLYLTRSHKSEGRLLMTWLNKGP